MNVCHDYNASVAARMRRLETDLEQPDGRDLGSRGADRPDHAGRPTHRLADGLDGGPRP